MALNPFQKSIQLNISTPNLNKDNNGKILYYFISCNPSKSFDIKFTQYKVAFDVNNLLDDMVLLNRLSLLPLNFQIITIHDTVYDNNIMPMYYESKTTANADVHSPATPYLNIFVAKQLKKEVFQIVDEYCIDATINDKQVQKCIIYINDNANNMILIYYDLYKNGDVKYGVIVSNSNDNYKTSNQNDNDAKDNKYSSTQPRRQPISFHSNNLIGILSELKQLRNPMDTTINSFVTLLSGNISVNKNEMLSLHNCVDPFIPHHKQKSFCNFAAISIYHHIPYIQFIVDIYTEMVLKNNISINEFISNSKCLSKIPKISTLWISLREYFSNYIRYIYAPFNCNNFNIHPTHNMKKVLQYITRIHQTIKQTKTLHIPQQIDVIFVSHVLDNINNEYFQNLNMKYVYTQMSYNNKNDYEINILQLFHDSTLCFGGIKNAREYKRSVILIMANDNDIDHIYMYQPLNHDLPNQISEYNELSRICKSKTSANIPLSDDDIFRITYNIHSDSIRVYFVYKSSQTRLFKRNIIDILSPFCTCINSISKTKWISLCNNGDYYGVEFEDDKYFEFKNNLFPHFVDISLNQSNEIEIFCNDNEFNNIAQVIADIEFPEQSLLVSSFPNIFHNVYY